MPDNVNMNCVAAGFLARRMMDRTLGEMDPDEVISEATGVVLDPDATHELTGVPPEDYSVVDPEALRERILDEYDTQRAVDSLVGALASDLSERETVIAARRESVYRCAGASASDAERAEYDRSEGDASAANRAREIFFFE